MNEARLYIDKGETVEVHTPWAGWVHVWLEDDRKLSVAVQKHGADRDAGVMILDHGKLSLDSREADDGDK